MTSQTQKLLNHQHETSPGWADHTRTHAHNIETNRRPATFYIATQPDQNGTLITTHTLNPSYTPQLIEQLNQQLDNLPEPHYLANTQTETEHIMKTLNNAGRTITITTLDEHLARNPETVATETVEPETTEPEDTETTVDAEPEEQPAEDDTSEKPEETLDPETTEPTCPTCHKTFKTPAGLKRHQTTQNH